jgi:hypothetical protein
MWTEAAAKTASGMSIPLPEKQKSSGSSTVLNNLLYLQLCTYCLHFFQIAMLTR